MALPNTLDMLTQWAMELQSIAQNGLTYTQSTFDRERFERIRQISAEMMSAKTGLPVETVKTLFCNEKGYQTPKIETRAAIFKENKILLVQEKGKWALPGGWVDYNLTVAENTVKEVKEEAGMDVVPLRLIALQDRNRHNPPPFAYGTLRLLYCVPPWAAGFSRTTRPQPAVILHWISCRSWRKAKPCGSRLRFALPP